MSVMLSTMSDQFGLKTWDRRVFVLKEVIDRHISLNGSMFMCFQKLIYRVVPGYIVRLLIY